MKAVKVFAPATVANFIVGFDSLGAAIEPLDGSRLGDVMTLEPASHHRLMVTGKYKDQLPQAVEDNLVMQCVNVFNKAIKDKGFSVDKFSMTLEKGLPICSGLGSSSASIIASLYALNIYYDYPFSDQELLLIAGRMEGVVSGSAHYDNVSPALSGGMQLMLSGGGVEPLPWFNDLLLVIYYPGIKISTKEARAALPKNFQLSDVVTYSQRLAGFINALYSGHKAQAMSLLADTIIQPYRGKLIPGFELGCEAATEAGSLAFGISGSGPSCFAVVDSFAVAKRVEQALLSAMLGGETAFSHIVKIGQGAIQLES